MDKHSWKQSQQLEGTDPMAPVATVRSKANNSINVERASFVVFYAHRIRFDINRGQVATFKSTVNGRSRLDRVPNPWRDTAPYRRRRATP